MTTDRYPAGSVPNDKRFVVWSEGTAPDSASADELTEDGYLKYFEYEFEIKDLLPTVPYWVNDTAFDFGSPQADLKALDELAATIAQKHKEQGLD